MWVAFTSLFLSFHSVTFQSLTVFRGDTTYDNNHRATIYHDHHLHNHPGGGQSKEKVPR